MRIKILLIIMLVIISSLLVSCKDEDYSDYSIVINREFPIRVNQTVSIIDEPFSVKLIRVNDGRCPAGAQCFAEDNVGAFIEIKKGLLVKKTEIGYGLNKPKSVDFEGYNIEYIAINPRGSDEKIVYLKVSKR